MSELLKPYLAWLHLHPHWAGFAAFLISFAESLAVVGLLIPGSVVMTAVGALIGAAILPFTGIALWSMVGAIAGDVLSFWVGYHYQQHIRERWPFRRYPKLLIQGELFFQRHGGKGVFLGRFIGPMRPIVPLIAGMMSMQPIRFVLVDVISGIFWAPVYMLPGILVGVASQELPPESAARLLLFMVAFLLLFWCISWLLKKTYQSIMLRVDQVLAYWWSWVKRHPRLFKLDQFIQDPRYPDNHGQFGLSLVCAVLIVLLGWLAYNVVHHGLLTYWNVPVYHLMRSLRTTLFDQIMVLTTFIGESPVIICMWLGVLIWLLLKRHWRAAVHWFLVAILCEVLVEGIKHLVHSPRPSGLLQSPPGWSFPSGHSTASTLLFGYFAVLLGYGRKRVWQWASAGIVSLIVLAIIISRLYLGAHWLTDVYGGILIGLAIICLLTVSYRRKAMSPVAPTGLILVAIVTLLLGWGWYVQKNYLKALHHYTPYWPSYTVSAKLWWEQTAKQIPQYRYNRFGKPMQLINLQWASQLSTIEHSLTAQGWHKESRRTLVILLSGLLTKDKTSQLPLLSQLYEDRRPVLMMTKYLTKQNTLVVLRLWDAHFKTDTGLPLWLGTIGYHHWRQHSFLKYDHAQIMDEKTNLLPATQLLIKDLKGFTWQQLHCKQIPARIMEAYSNENGYVLLIQPKV